jgi:class 3 adenylate cyclase/tetratricopeptide (TPR) repeat protein
MTIEASAACPACGAQRAVLTARYCFHCGKKFDQDPDGSEPAAAAQGKTATSGHSEKRQTTILFCDLVDSTALSARLEPEEFVVVLKAFLNTTTAIVHDHHGFVARYMGDGLLVYFGYPRAEEHSAELAIRAGLKLVKTVQSLRTLPGVFLQARVGIATGIVVVGDLIGAGSSREAPALGVTPNLAARLQSTARPGQVLVAPETHALVGRLFDCNALGEHLLKGLPEAIAVWEVLAARSVESRFDALRPFASLIGIVGRQKELARLDALRRRVQQGRGQIAFIVGDAGIGKSKLVGTFLGSVPADVVGLLRVQCSPSFENSAFFPVIDLLHRLVPPARSDTDRPAAQSIEAFLRERHRLSENEAQLINDLLAPSAEEGFTLPTLASERRKEDTLEALQSLIAAITSDGPCTMVFEDAQWADPSTVELLARLVQRLSRLSLLLLITCRPQFDINRVTRKSVPRIVLARLGRKDSSAIVSEICSGKALPADLMELIVTRTDGVPLFIEELAKTILESSALQESEDRYEYKSSSAMVAIPATLRDSLMARLDRDRDTKIVAQTAAIIGREFNYALLSVVVDLPATELVAALTSLTRSGLILAKKTEPGEYVFKHALVQDIARDSLLGSRRQELHLKIAHALQAQPSELARCPPELLAHHYTEAKEYVKGVEYWRLAGMAAVRRFANREAVANFRRALHALSCCPGGTERDARELELHAILGQVLVALSGYASREVEDSFHRGRKLFSTALNSTHKALVLRTECLFLIVKARYAETHEPARELARLGAEHDDRRAEATADFAQGLAHLYQGNFDQARASMERGLVATAMFPDSDEAVQCLAYLGRTLWFLGYPDLAMERCAEALKIARRAPQRRVIPQAAGVMALVSHIRGDLQATKKWMKSTLRQSTTKGYSYWVSLALILDTWLRAHDEGGAASVAEISHSIEKYEATGARLGLSCFLLLQAEAHQQIGQFDEALATLDTALAHIDRTAENYYTAEVHRRRGEVYAACSEPALAEPFYARALELSRAQHARGWELRSATSLAALWHRQGQHERAYRMLNETYAAFSEGFDTADLRTAAQLLRELSPFGPGGQISSVSDQTDQPVRS